MEPCLTEASAVTIQHVAVPSFLWYHDNQDEIFGNAMKRKGHIVPLLLSLTLPLFIIMAWGERSRAEDIDRAGGINGDLIRIREKSTELEGLVVKIPLLGRIEGESILGDASLAAREILVHSLKVKGKVRSMNDAKSEEFRAMKGKVHETAGMIDTLKEPASLLGPLVWEDWIVWPAKGISMARMEGQCLETHIAECSLRPCIKCCSSTFKGESETELKQANVCRWECSARFIRCAIDMSEEALESSIIR